MKKIIAAALTLAFAGSVSAAGMDDMVGKWSWEGFTVDVSKCDATGVCAKVTAGPKNVGMEMMKSKLEMKDGAYVGKVAHPQTGLVYNARMTLADKDTWSMNGCTDQGVCAEGNFKRVK